MLAKLISLVVMVTVLVWCREDGASGPGVYDVARICHHHDPSKSILFLSRMDGMITAVELSKSLPVLWEYDLGYPLISTSSTLSFKEDSVLVPSMDGNLYTLNTSDTNPVIQPYANLDTLLKRRPEPNQRSRWVGGKVLTTVGLGPTDGRVFYKCDVDDCKRHNTSTVGNDPILAITSERKTVRLLDLKLGVESWNWSIAAVDVQYLGVKERSSCLPPDLDLNFSFDVHNGEVLVQFPDSTVDTLRVGSTISQAWVLNDELLQTINIFYSEDSDPRAVNIFLGHYNNMLYIQPFLQHHSIFGIGHINDFIFQVSNSVSERAGRSTISWEYDKPGTTAVATRDPFQDGMVGKVWTPQYNYIPKSAVQQLIESTVDVTKRTPGGLLVSLGLESSVVEQMFMTVVLAGVLGYFIYRKVLKPKANLTTTSTSTELEGVDSSISGVLSTPGLQSGSHFNFDNINQSQPAFESRFEQDFEVIRELGEGGFGKVLEARHRISDHNYAIKVIKLPSRDDLKKKVEREVAALAKLEHPNILRYYTSWKETPTADWARARRYTTNSESFDSGTGGSTISNRAQNLKPSTSGIYSGGSSTNQAALSHTRPNTTTSSEWSEGYPEGSESIVFQEESSSSGVLDRVNAAAAASPPERSDSIVFERTNGGDVSDSIVFAASQSGGGGGGRPKRLSLNLHLEGEETSNKKLRNSSTSRSVTFSTWSEEGGTTGPDTPSIRSPQSPSTPRPSFLYIQMQLCSDDTLKEWLLKNSDRSGVMRIFTQIVDAVVYIHSQHHIHRDLKPSNILFADNGDVKVADFGLATAMSTVHSSSGGTAASPEYNGPSLTHNLGTKLYMSPELESNRFYDFKVDIYALGIILFELLVVFGTYMERVECIQQLRDKHVLPPCLDSTFPKYKLILLQMLADNPKDRPTAAEVKTLISGTDVSTVIM